MFDWVGTLTGNFLLTGAGAAMVVVFLKKALSNADMERWGEIHGKFLSWGGRLRFGKTFYEKVEEWAIGAVGCYLKGVKKGLLTDNIANGKVNAEKKDAPSITGGTDSTDN